MRILSWSDTFKIWAAHYKYTYHLMKTINYYILMCLYKCENITSGPQARQTCTFQMRTTSLRRVLRGKIRDHNHYLLRSHHSLHQSLNKTLKNCIWDCNKDTVHVIRKLPSPTASEIVCERSLARWDGRFKMQAGVQTGTHWSMAQ